VDQSIQFEDAVLQYSKFGNGSEVLLALHGFGQDRQAFSELETKLAFQYTVFSFDIFFHGKSEWSRGENPLEKSFWRSLMLAFLKHNKIDRFNILGFSMGGKFALATLEAFPEKIDKTFLLAPDGIKINPWYKLATYPWVMRKIFKSMIRYPSRFQFIATWACKVGFIDKGILRFVESQMNTEEKRKQVYYSWVVFRHLKFDVTKIATLINSNSIKLMVVIGKYDKLVTVNHVQKLLKRVENHKLEILETGHTGLISKLGIT
jgi:pimeloyl-ACP methyl ester carboxylesterase